VSLGRNGRRTISETGGAFLFELSRYAIFEKRNVPTMSARHPTGKAH
jgi:hypothetical protein